MVLSLLNNEVLGEDPFYIEITSVGAGTGNYNSFLRLQAGGTEEGYNTDTNGQADNKNGIWTHSLKLSDMAILTIDGKTYYEVRLDVNEDNTAAGTPITLSELWIMGSAAAATGANFSDDNNYANDFAGFHRVFDLNGSVALQDVNEGSGTDDYRILIPTTSFDPGDVYFTLYSRFTGTDGGFEEWRVLGSDGGTNEPPPAITVNKVANVTTIAEGTPTDVIFTYTLTSQSAASDPLRLDTLVDDSATALNLADDVDLLTGFVFGSNYGTYYVSGDADGDYLLDSTETWTFRYTADDMVLDASDTRTNVVTVVAHDNEATQVTDSDNASVTGTDILPAISLVKMANPTSISEGTATNVVYTYAVSSQSKSTDPILLTSFVDDAGTPGLANAGDDVNLLAGFVFGSNHGTYYVSGDADGDYLLDSTEVWNFSYTASNVVKDVSDSPWTNIAVVKGTDDEGNQATAQDDASVTVTDVLPAISLVKTANPTSISEGTATNVVYTYAVSSQSKSTDPILLTSFVDDAGTPGLANAGDDVNLLAGFVFGSNHGTYYVSGDADGDYLLDSTEVWNFSYTASNVVKDVSDSPWTNIAVVKGTDDEGNQATAHDDASVTVTDVLPDVAIVKTASTNEVQAGAVTSVTFTYAITNESTVSTDPLTIVTLIDDNGTPLDGLDDKDLSALYVSGDNGNGLLDVGETWIYQWTTDILLMPGESYTNIACVSVTDDEGNPVGACDDETIISSVNQAYTPGFWSNNASPIWDGKDTTYAKSGGLGLVTGAPKNNGPEGAPKDLLYVLHDSTGDGIADGNQSGFLMIGDWDKNGVADDGNNVLIVSRDYALSLLNASTKEQQDGRYQVSRDVVASWLNYVSGSYVGDADKADGFDTTADYIQEAVDWLIATTSGNEILMDNELKNTAKVGMNSDAWKLGVDTGPGAGFELLAGSTIHANLDYFNNNGYILP